MESEFDWIFKLVQFFHLGQLTKINHNPCLHHILAGLLQHTCNTDSFSVSQPSLGQLQLVQNAPTTTTTTLLELEVERRSIYRLH